MESVRIGNFVLSEEDGASGRFISCTSVSDGWKVSWRDDTEMYGIMMMFCRDKATHEYLHGLLNMMYVATCYPHDLVSIATRKTAPFMNGFAALYNDEVAYELSLKKGVGKSKDDEALQEAADMESLREDMKEMIEDEMNGNASKV